MTTSTAAVQSTEEPALGPVPRRARRAGVGDLLSVRRCSAIYVLIALVIVFGGLAPSKFLHVDTLLVILNGSAISGIVAVTLVLPMASGVFDVSVGYVVGLAGTLVAFLVASGNLSGTTALIVTLAAGVAFAGVNILVVVVLKINSFIGTLATGAIFLSLTTAFSNQQSITDNVGRLQSILGGSWLRLSTPVWVLLGLTVIITVVMRWTPFGRYCFAIGFNREAARLAGLPVKTLQTVTLICSGIMASMAGVLLTARLGAGTPTEGPDYLLPAFAAVFVGMTQFVPGRFNAPGTVVATYLLATAADGLNVVGAPLWVPELIQGVILIVAVAFNTASGANMRARFGWKRRIPRPGGLTSD